MKRRIETDFAPQPVGPYSQAIEWDGWIWCAGMVGLDPRSGQLVEGGVAAEAERALRSLQAVLDRSAAVNGVSPRFSPDPPPARSTFAVAALPRGAQVEIEAVARARPD